jgi:hypothetical protein
VTVRGAGIQFDGNGTADCETAVLDADPSGSATITSVEVLNGSQAEGSFVATVGTATSVPGGTPELFGAPAVINPAVEIRYLSSDVEFRSTVPVLEGNIG